MSESAEVQDTHGMLQSRAWPFQCEAKTKRAASVDRREPRVWNICASVHTRCVSQGERAEHAWRYRGPSRPTQWRDDTLQTLRLKLGLSRVLCKVTGRISRGRRIRTHRETLKHLSNFKSAGAVCKTDNYCSFLDFAMEPKAVFGSHAMLEASCGRDEEDQDTKFRAPKDCRGA